MTDEEWAAWEASHFLTEQQRLDRVRVGGYMMSRAIRVKAAHEELQRRVTLLLRARQDAERQLAVLREELEHAEEIARLIALGDTEVLEGLARMLEELEESEGEAA